MKKNSNRYGFSLIEISIVLLVVAVAVSSGVMVFNKYSDESKISQTEFTMKQVMTAIKQYALEYGELPCPANPALASNNSQFGLSQTAGTCTDTITVGDSRKGMVPVSSLNLFPSLALDAWGNRMDYIVIKDDTVLDELANPYNSKKINLSNYGGTEYDRIIVLLLSHGANGYGAYSGRGGTGVKDASSASNEEKDNNAGSPLSASIPYQIFDDIIYFWTYDQITNEDVMK